MKLFRRKPSKGKGNPPPMPNYRTHGLGWFNYSQHSTSHGVDLRGKR